MYTLLYFLAIPWLSRPLFSSSPLPLLPLPVFPLFPSPSPCVYFFPPLSSVNASVGSISMSGVPQPNRQTMILSSNLPTTVKESKHLVDFHLEIHPLSKPWMDASVKAALQPMQIIYDFVRM